MNNSSYDPNDDIMALATPWGESAIAVIRTSGSGAVSRTASIFSNGNALSGAKKRCVFFGTMINPETGKAVDEAIVTVFPGPNSYTGQNVVEISIHGSLPGINAVLALLRTAGFRDASPGEFTFRAFLNGKKDLTQAEAVQEIVSSKTVRAQELAMERLSGGILNRLKTVRDKLLVLAGSLSVQIDYAEDDIEDLDLRGLEEFDSAKSDLEWLLDTYSTGRIYQEGVTIAIAGRTNAGKSSLFNLFLREDRSIVSDFHGTTRDFIESWITIGGIPIRLVDTAGFRKADHPVEEEGIRRSEAIIHSADLVLYLIDGTAGKSTEDDLFLKQNRETGKPFIQVWTKTDLDVPAAPEQCIPISATTGEGLPDLEEKIAEMIVGKDPFEKGEVVIDSERQFRLIQQCVESLDAVRTGLNANIPADALALDMQNALNSLGELTGEITIDDMFETMFSRFCVGK